MQRRVTVTYLSAVSAVQQSVIKATLSTESDCTLTFLFYNFFSTGWRFIVAQLLTKSLNIYLIPFLHLFYRRVNPLFPLQQLKFSLL